ncbi:MOSC domain-containing protein [Ancylobacter lacus]|uniref:MOSC domain-containing protein n=1 Tax=Ancylobacter lacus TaxID=2579970 RepID=UPI001BCCED91|nr:MOSC domain-containing protein [Ancylobacter lacus]MBS7539788.1 molybdenum cofactor sulfurase [Ancylobacter lacus]
MGQQAELFGVADEMPAQRFRARLAQLLVADGVGFGTRPVDRLDVDLEGIAGDRHRGFARPACSRVPWFPRRTPIRNSRQISIVAPDELVAIAARLGVAEVRAEWLGANMVLEGVGELTRLPPGTRLHAGGVTLVVEGENAPCRHAGQAVAAAVPDAPAGLDLAFVTAARGLRGLVGWVERAGELVSGTQVDVWVPAQRLWRR